MLPLMKTDLVEPVMACVEGKLGGAKLEWTGGAAVCVALVSGGYPGAYERGKVIEGADGADTRDDVIVFHAGTALDKEGRLVTAGGRVLGVTGLGEHIVDAMETAYEAVGRIQFEGMYFRRDIGAKAIERLAREEKRG
jgi:phosphoribosylamine--glycine ligase